MSSAITNIYFNLQLFNVTVFQSMTPARGMYAHDGWHMRTMSKIERKKSVMVSWCSFVHTGFYFKNFSSHCSKQQLVGFANEIPQLDTIIRHPLIPQIVVNSHNVSTIICNRIRKAATPVGVQGQGTISPAPLAF